MKTMMFTEMQTTIQARKRALGIVDTEAQTEALRNKGGNRTPEKRAALQSIQARAAAAGVQPVTAYF